MFFYDFQLRDYGYGDKQGTNGNLPSGPHGSGIVPITLSLMIGMTFIWLLKLFTFDSSQSGGEKKSKAHEESKKD